MRKLWPPTFDEVSMRFWAAAVSFSLNLGAGLFFYFRHQMELLFFFWPGVFASMLITRQSLDEGSDGWMAWLGLIMALATNLAFYYFAAWWMIKAFQPAKSWWPEKRSWEP